MRVSLSNTERSFSLSANQTVLDGALKAGLRFPYGCRGGNCGACRAKLLDGKVRYPNGTPLGLAKSEAAHGFILLCQAVAETDLHIEHLQMSPPDAVLKRLPCRIERIERAAHDVAIMFLRLPAAEPLVFEPGQYVDIILAGDRRRSFSIASPPHDSRQLELHVRHVAGGAFSAELFAANVNDMRLGRLLTIAGPLGRFSYRHVTSTAPLLLIGGGTGLAPLKSILRHVIESGLQRAMKLYWGVRSERDLYAHAALQTLAQRATGLRYVAVLSEPSSEWHGRRGWVHEAVLEDVPDLGGHDVYASGPPAMIAAIRRDFGARGLDPSKLHFDSFDYACDTLERQRTIAASKS